MKNQIHTRLKQEVDKLEELKLKRVLQPSEVFQNCIDFTSNDYLGIGIHPDFHAEDLSIDLSIDLSDNIKTKVFTDSTHSQRNQGALGSRLLGGDAHIFHQLETTWSNWKGAEASLYFNSGYAANLGVMQALAGAQTHVFSDKLNHASIYDGIRLSGAILHRYKHNDTNHLELLLEQYPGEQIIITESVFSMDGDVAPLCEIVNLAQRFNSLLIVDEAHSDGIWGTEGRGLVHHLGLQNKVDLIVSTLGKAFACSGALVSGDEIYIQALIQKARSFIFSTAAPPHGIQQVLKSISLVKKMDYHRAHLLNLAQWFRDELKLLQLDTLKSSTQIIPIVLGSNERALYWAAELFNRGFWIQAIRHPTVPKNSARLRINIHANHSQEDLQQLLDAIKEILSHE